MSTSSPYVLIESTSKRRQSRSIVREFVTRLITAPILLYALCFVIYQIILLTPLGDLWWVRFYDIFGYLLYLPLPLLLLFLLFPGQRKVRALALLIPLLFFVYEYGSAFAPKMHLATVASAQADLPLRVMTWNTYFKNENVENLLAAVTHENPDILALQEFGADYADEFAKRLKATYPYQLLYPSWQPKGYAIFSRYPLKEIAPPLSAHGSCPCAHATVTIQDRPVTLISIHPTVPNFEISFQHRVPVPTLFETDVQDFQHEIVLNRIAVVDTPLLVLGDFNANDRMAVIDRYRAVLTDSFREAGWGFGFTFPYESTFRSFVLPSLVRLDYIFHDDAWRAVRAWVGQAHGADHRYVVADLVLKRP